MSSCTQIIARGLSPETVGRLGGATEAVLDLPPGFSNRFSKDAERLSSINKIISEGVLSFNLPYSAVNDAVFVDFESPLVLDQIRDFISVSVRIDGHEIGFDRLAVIGRVEKDSQWECQLFRRSDHWIELIQEKALNTIDFGDYFYLTKDNVVATWDAPAYAGDFTPTVEPGTGLNGVAHFPLLDFGNLVDQTEQPQLTNAPWKPVCLEDFRPLLSFVYILKRGFCEIGWNLEGLIFDTEWFRRLWVYLLKPDFYDGENQGYKYGRAGRITGRVLDARYQIQPSSNKLYLTTIEFSLGNTSLPYISSLSGKWRMGIKSQLPFLSKYKFRAKFKVTNENPNPTSLVFSVAELSPTNTANSFETGEILSDDFQVDLDAGETKEVLLELDALVGYNQKAALIWANPDFGNIYIEAGLWFQCDPDNKSFTRFDYIDLAAMIDPKLRLFDAFKAAIHLCRGLLETDFDTRTVYVFPNRTANVHGEIAPPFLKIESPSIDIDDKIICDSIRQLPQKLNQKRYTRLEFADSSDAFVQSLKLPDKLYSRTILNGLDLPDETTRLTNPMFEPTADEQMIFSKIYGRDHRPRVPRLWDNTDNERSFNIGPRIFFAFGKIKQKFPTPITPADQYCGFYFDGLEKPGSAAPDYVQQFGYVSQFREWEVEPTPTIDGSVVFGQRELDLYVMFYLGLTAENRRGIILDALMTMTADEYNRINFRDIYKFTYLGREFNVPMTSIRDAAPCSDAPSPVQFFVAPVDSTCCDLPCGCQFVTCDYYQDLGTFITQTTMNQLYITSFKVDDVEFIVDPIALGIINMVDLAGRPYITNLVDKLNSIGVPYFVFSYSTRVHPEKGLRFFKIKRPACQSFEIIISQLANEVYRYTDTEQQTQWFGGGWAPLGYGSGFYSTPIGCVTTTEY